MRFATVLEDDGPTWAVVDGEELVLPSALSRNCRSLTGLVERGLATGLSWGRHALDNPASRRVPLSGADLGAPIVHPPRNVMCLGMNYAEHARESLAASGKDFELPQTPVVFTKSATSVVGPYDPIPLDRRATEQLDWEVELGVVIGTGGRHIPAERALEHVFGYTVINDVSARDRQFGHKQFYLGKSLPGACPMGPWLVTADELTDPHGLKVTCDVNGTRKQDGNTSDLIFDVAQIIHILSTVHPLVPGDVIATGTPSGVGFARKPPEFLGDGDEVECAVEGIGAIRNRVVAAD